MTINLLTIPLPELAALCADFTYADIPDLDAYFRAELMLADDETIDTRADLAAAIARDIDDMLHNCNLDMLFPSYELDMLDELNPHTASAADTHDALADRILNFDYFADFIAARIRSR